MHAGAFDDALEILAASRVDLHGHEAVSELDDRRIRSHRLQRATGLEAEQTTSDDGAAHLQLGVASGRVRDVAPKRLDIVEGAVDETTRDVAPLDGRHCGVRARCQDEGVVRDVLAALRLDGSRVSVDAGDERARAQRHAFVVPDTLVEQQI